MIVVFDLDDTLYDESNFVESGFRAVAKFAAEKLGLNRDEVFRFMQKTLAKEGRGQVFDLTFSHFGIKEKKHVKKAISVYRLHKPEIRLLPDAMRCLKRLKNLPIYIVTDGNKLVQSNKIDALGLRDMVKRVFITYRHGRVNSKPSPYCFLKIAQLERVPNEKIVYIGDNPQKDFVGLNPLGFKTVRILRGEHKDKFISEEHEAQVQIDTLDALTEEFLIKLGEKNE